MNLVSLCSTILLTLFTIVGLIIIYKLNPIKLGSKYKYDETKIKNPYPTKNAIIVTFIIGYILFIFIYFFPIYSNAWSEDGIPQIIHYQHNTTFPYTQQQNFTVKQKKKLK
jgi:hypothetical protein